MGHNKFNRREYGPDDKFDADTEAMLAKANKLLNLTLRGYQRQAVNSVYNGRDVVLQAATGAGKSAPAHAMLAAKKDAIILSVGPLKAMILNQVTVYQQF